MENLIFKKIFENLARKKLDFCAFQEFLSLASLNDLTQYLKTRVDLQAYFHFLEHPPKNAQQETLADPQMQYSPKNAREETLADPQMHTPPSHLQQMFSGVQWVGLKLLQENRLSLEILNSLLLALPKNETLLKSFLRDLYFQKKISLEEFIAWFAWATQNNFPELPKATTESAYRCRLQEQQFEFYWENKAPKKILGHYQLLEELGRGGMGVVYKAYHLELKRFSALKLLIEESFSEQKRKRFLREIQAMSALNHPGIVQIIDSGEEDDKPYFVMEFVEGVSLQEWMQSPHSLRERLVLLQKITSALAYAHQQGILHRDLKPANILVSPQGEPKIADFGLAKQVLSDSSSSQKLTQTGALLGTVAYMPPEIARGEISQVSVRSDIYSLGACFYEVLTGQFPHQASTIPPLLRKIIEETPLPPSHWNTEIRADLDCILLKTLEKDQKDRYPDAEALSEDVLRFLNGMPIEAKPTPKWKLFLREIKRQRLKMTAFVTLFSFLFFFNIFLPNTQQRERQKQFQMASEQANQLRDKLLQVPKQVEYKKERFSILLQFLNQLNTALYYQENYYLKKEQSKARLELIQMACQLQEYTLASYMARELHKEAPTQIVLPKVLEEIEQYQTQQKQKHLEKLNLWKNVLTSRILSEEEKKEIIFEIIKMPEPEVLQKLVKTMIEGTLYFSKTNAPHPLQEQFFNVFVQALGRMEKPSTAKNLSVALQNMGVYLLKFPRGQYPFPHLNYAVTIAHALGQTRETQYYPMLDALRDQMGANSVFWTRTRLPYQKLLRKKMSSEEGPKNIEALFERASSRHDVKDWAGVIEDLELVIQADPKKTAAHNLRGLAHYYLKKYDESIPDFSKAIELNPNHVEAYNNRANSWLEKGELLRALKDYDSAIERKPNYISAYMNRGTCRREMGDFSGALEDYEQVLTLDPQFTEAYINRGNLFFQLKDFQRALADFNHALELNPQCALCYHNRGKAKEILNDDRGALADYTRSLELNPQDANTYSSRGLLKRKKRDYAGAITDFQIVTQMEPANPTGYYHLGLCYQDLKQLSKTLENYRIFLKLIQEFPNPKYKEARDWVLAQFPELQPRKK